MLKTKKINPLNVFDSRRVKFAPPHFEYVNIPMTYNLEDSIVKWIKQHLKNRFFVGTNVSLNNDNKLIQVLTIGFEENKDMSYFMLACPHLKYK
jgi:hypothetical protein